ncbi:acyltransferase [Pseudoalteromonas sp. TB64]|uniref:acyltransferase family protein n=1 Tax=Pseudoalteromonas sp. TB64 TaxID=1938600 RepID=UPI00040F9CD8|nr:acyltransferase [Pseudoalteromonas sp. TB64]
MQKQRYYNLDAFRGIAALLVLFFHSPFYYIDKTTFITNSDVLVDFFFILSGFVITHAYKDKIKTVNAFTFMQNRFARIYPLHIFLLVVWLVFIFLKYILFIHFNLGDTSPFINNDLYSFILNFLLLNAHGLDDHLSWNTPSWSIGSEFYSYLLFFLVAKSVKKQHLLYWAIVLFLVAYTTIYILKPTTLLRTFDLGFIRAIGGFFLGVTVYHIRGKKTFSDNSKRVVTTIELALLIAVYSAITLLATNKLGQLVIFFIFAITVYYFSLSNGSVSYLLKTKVMQYLGKISYSIYLTHFLIIIVATNLRQYVLPTHSSTPFDTPAAPFINIGIAILTCVISSLTYRFIEQPLQQKLGVKRVIK